MDNNTYDLAILTDPPHSPHLSQYTLRDNTLVFIIHPAHPLAQKKSVTLSELEAVPFIMRESTALISQMLLELSVHNRLTLKTLFEMDSTEAVKQAVISGLGTALVPRLCIERELKYGILKLLNIDGIQLCNKWVLTCAKYTEHLKIFQNFLSFSKK